MSPVVISRGVLRVLCNCQQNRSLVGVVSLGSGQEEALQLSLWQSFASGFGSQKQQRVSFYTDPRRGSGSLDPGLGWSEAGVGNCPLSETFSLAFGFSMRKWLVRAGERRALRISPDSDIFTFQTPASSFHLSWFWHV